MDVPAGIRLGGSPRGGRREPGNVDRAAAEREGWPGKADAGECEPEAREVDNQDGVRAERATEDRMGRYEQFQAFRSKMNARILGDDAQRDGRTGGTLNTKRFFTLDGKTYEDGALPARTKELLGLVA